MVNKWVNRFNEDRLDGLKEDPRSGWPRALPTEQLVKFKAYVVSHAINPYFTRLKGLLWLPMWCSNFRWPKAWQTYTASPTRWFLRRSQVACESRQVAAQDAYNSNNLNTFTCYAQFIRQPESPPLLTRVGSIEQVWQWLNNNELANCCFEG